MQITSIQDLKTILKQTLDYADAPVQNGNGDNQISTFGEGNVFRDRLVETVDGINSPDEALNYFNWLCEVPGGQTSRYAHLNNIALTKGNLDAMSDAAIQTSLTSYFYNRITDISMLCQLYTYTTDPVFEQSDDAILAKYPLLSEPLAQETKKDATLSDESLLEMMKRNYCVRQTDPERIQNLMCDQGDGIAKIQAFLSAIGFVNSLSES
ncbi:MAG: hypothetical protein ABII18_11935 [bacterium]|nr:hypothetical protein [bacterium]